MISQHWQVMAWCLQATSHYLSQCWLRSMSLYMASRGHDELRYSGTPVNTLRPRQSERHLADDIFKCIFVNENVWIPIKISLKFVPKGPINNIPALVQIMAWRRPGDKPLSEPMMARLLMHICVTRPQWVNKIFWPTQEDSLSIGQLTTFYEWQTPSFMVLCTIYFTGCFDSQQQNGVYQPEPHFNMRQHVLS